MNEHAEVVQEKLKSDPTLKAFDAARHGPVPVVFAGADLPPDLAALEKATASLQYFRKIVLDLRADRDYWRQRWKFQQVANEGAIELHRLHKEQVDRLTPRINEYEWLLGLIPGCEGDFDQAKAKLIQTFGLKGKFRQDVQDFQDGARAQPPRETHCTVSIKQMGVADDVRSTHWALYCDNCREYFAWADVGIGREESFKVLRPFWEEHIRSKSPVDNLSRNATPDAGTEEPSIPHNIVPALSVGVVSNPNAGMTEAFPGGRW